MFSYFDLLIIFIVSILFVLVFRIQRNMFPTNYFANSDLVLNSFVTYRMLSIRYIIIFFFGLASYFLVNNTSTVVVGTFLGSFLIIWPTLLSPFKAYVGIVKKNDIIFIYLQHLVFVTTSVIVIYFATILLPLLQNHIYENRVGIFLEVLKFLIFSSLGLSSEKILGNILDKRIGNNNDLVNDNEQKEDL